MKTPRWGFLLTLMFIVIGGWVGSTERACTQKPVPSPHREISPLEQTVLGKWQEIGGEESLVEFFPDGKFLYVEKGKRYTGQYHFLENNRLQFDFGGWFGAQVYEVRISGDEMFLTESNGEVSKFKKVR